MTLTTLLGFWAIAALAAWVQSLTGFALGMIVMGSVTLLGLMPVSEAAQVTSLLVIINAALVLLRGWRGVDRAALFAMLIGAAPGILLGYVLLLWLAGSALEVLRLLLGLSIVIAALQLTRRPDGLPQRQHPTSFGIAGFVGGIFGGLFSTSGPPVIWQMYRQPLSLEVIRVTLVCFFCLTQIWRLGIAVIGGDVSNHTLLVAAGAAPTVLLATWAARRFPPPVAPATIRKAALWLLFLNGAALIITAAVQLA